MDSARRIDAARDRGIQPLPSGRRHRLTRLLALALLAGCSGVSANEDGIASLELRFPSNSFLEAGSTIRLGAVARNGAGDSVDAAIRWRSADTTVAIDSVTGVVTTVAASGTARIQAGVFGQDTILTAINGLIITITARADSIVLLTPDSIDVAEDTASAQIRTRILGGTPAVGVVGRPVSIRILEPAPADSTVAFATGRSADSVMTDGNGGTTSLVRARRGRTPPDRAVVEIRAHRASGEPIPGSPMQVVIRFRHQ